MTSKHLIAVSTLALMAAVPAGAQTTQSVTEPAVPASDAQDTDYGSANDIVVTATRRNETVQEVPIAVTAVGAELLKDANVTDIRGLEQLAPSLQTTTGQSQATGSSLSIRGIGTAGDNPGFEPAVGVFIDGVFRARAGVALAELPELQRVEVLRGPQGTLFGRNTSAGALSIYTAQPAFDLGGYVEGVYGNYNAYELRGAINLPVAEALAVRFDGAYRKRDGYIEDANSDRAINDIDRFTVRGQALYDTSGFSFRLIGDYFETDEKCCGAVSIVRGPLAPAIQAIAGAQGLTGLYVGRNSPQTFINNGVPTVTDVTRDPDRIQAISPNRDFSERVRDWGVSGEFNIDVGASKLTSITAYRKWQVLRDQDVDFSGIDRAYRDDYKSSLSDFTQEIRLQGSAFGGALDFLIGGFYLNETNRLRDTVRIGNDGNRYVDFALNGGTRSAALPSGAQFYGSFGVPTLQQVGAAFQGLAPLPAGSVPLFGQVVYLQNPFVAPGVRLQQIAPPGSALFNLLNTPLPAAVAGQGNNNDDFEVKTNAFALFTHNIINLTDKLTLTIGARYNYEKKDLSATINNNLGSCAFFDQIRAGNVAANTYAALLRGAAPGNALFNNLFLLSCNPAVNNEFNGNYEDDRSDRALTGTVKLAYKFTPDVLGYASYDRGFKSGGYNLDQATFDSVLLGGNGPQGSDLAFDKEKVDSYEIGLKTQWGREFTFNIAAFYAKYQDLQNLVFAGNNFIVQNVSDSTSKGVEVESIIRPVREWTLRLGYTYNDVQTDEGVTFPAGSPLEGSQGQQFGNVPKHVVSIASTWTPPLSDSINGLLHVDMRYNSNVNIAGVQPNGRSIVSNPGYPMINARVGVTTEDRTKSLEFFVENLTNQYFNITGFPVPEQTGNFAGYPSTPRFYGVRARFGF